MIDVIVDKFALGVADRMLNSMKLLRQMQAGFASLNHADKGCRSREHPGNVRDTKKN